MDVRELLREDPHSEVRALLEAMFCVARADGEFSLSERRYFMSMVESLSEGRMDSSDLLEIVEYSERALAREGLSARLRALAAQLPDETARRLAYALSTQVALLEGAMGSAERRVLEEMAQVFSLSAEEHEEIQSSVRFSSQHAPPLE